MPLIFFKLKTVLFLTSIRGDLLFYLLLESFCCCVERENALIPYDVSK